MVQALIRPLRSIPLGLCVVLSLFVALLYRPGVPGALLQVVAMFVVLRYGYLIVESVTYAGAMAGYVLCYILAVFFMMGWLMGRHREDLVP